MAQTCRHGIMGATFDCFIYIGPIIYYVNILIMVYLQALLYPLWESNDQKHFFTFLIQHVSYKINAKPCKDQYMLQVVGIDDGRPYHIMVFHQADI